jgi:hypothetical protein
LPSTPDRPRSKERTTQASRAEDPSPSSSPYGRGLAKQHNGALAEGNLDINNAKAMDPNIAGEFASDGMH